MTTAGSLALEGSIATQDAFVVARLRAAGAVILGKTNLSEWANFRSTHSTSGWSGRGGQVKNPYVLDRNPCGSSSGTGAAIAANLAAIGVGTETDGSIVCPSGANGLVGIKPTVGLVSRSGIIPISHSQDTAGPMARTVADAAVLLSAMAGVDPADPRDQAEHRREGRDYTKSLDAGALKGARIGVARKQYFGYSEPTDARDRGRDRRHEGAGRRDRRSGEHSNRVEDGRLRERGAALRVQGGPEQVSEALGPEAPVHSLDGADRVQRTREGTRDAVLRPGAAAVGREERTADDASVSRGADEVPRAGARAGHRPGDAAIRLDALVAPTGSPAWTTDLVNGDHFTGASSTPAAVAGYPSITVPAGEVFGLPVGVSFIGRAWSEPRLIALAYAYEQATKHRRPPRFKQMVPSPESQVPVPSPKSLVVVPEHPWTRDLRLGT